jgi:hypothetical protein
MANLPETSNFDAGVYQIETTDPVVGGANGVSNTPLKNLANRTKYLKDHVDSIESNYALKASPTFTGIPAAPTASAGTSTTQIATTQFVQQAVSATAPASQVAAQSCFKNLKISTTGLSATVTVSYDELILGNGSGSYVVERSVSGSINTAATGAGGLDTGSLAASTWYSVWRIATTGGTFAWLISLSATAPTMPSGYTLKARIGWIRTDGTANKYPLSMVQWGRRVAYKLASGSNLTALPAIASGGAGSVTTPTWVAVSTASAVPSTAWKIAITAATGSLAGGIISVAPSNLYGNFNSVTSPPPISTIASSGAIVSGELVLESSNLYWASNTNTGLLIVTGWEDNI